MHFDATKIGIIVTLAVVVGLAAALASDKIVSRWGVGRLIVAGQTSMALGGVLLAAVAGPTLQAGATMLAAEAAVGVGLSFYGVGSRTLNQTRIPAHLRSRVIGASWVLTLSLVALAGIIGGGIGTTIGLRPTMAVGSASMIVAFLATLRRSVWKVQATAPTVKPEDRRPSCRRRPQRTTGRSPRPLNTCWGRSVIPTDHCRGTGD